MNIRDRKGNIVNQNPEIDAVFNNLKEAGFNHCGYNLLFESVKPRFEAK